MKVKTIGLAIIGSNMQMLMPFQSQNGHSKEVPTLVSI
jgi:hypothetical protein